ncbi:MAG: HlyD family secretion protein [Bacteroidota bacterium]
MPKSSEKLELRPAEVQEILNKPPNLLLSAGPLLLLALILASFGAASYISYPDTVEARAKIIAFHPPHIVQAPQTGILTSISPASTFKVKQGTGLGEIRNATHASIELQAPIDGQAYSLGFHKIGSEIQAQDSIFLIIPKENQYYGKVTLPHHLKNSLQINQKVTFALDPYPTEEYGQLIGYISQISPLSQNERINVKVTFPDGLKTSTGFELSYTPNLKGKAKVMIKDMSLLDRLIRRNQPFLGKSQD